MKKLLILISIFLVSCSEITQHVTYDQNNGLSVETYTNGLYNHGYDDFHIIQLAEPNQIDSIKKLQMQIAQEYLKLAK